MLKDNLTVSGVRRLLVYSINNKVFHLADEMPVFFVVFVYFRKLTCWKGDIFLAMEDGISCSHCELCEKDSQRSESLKHKDW